MFQTPSVPEVNQWAIRGVSLRYKTLDKLEETGDVEACCENELHCRRSKNDTVGKMKFNVAIFNQIDEPVEANDTSITQYSDRACKNYYTREI
jgi:hypothetical protein